ncbi:MAG: DNA alkylation repair protein [Candidatus Parcubacteria bacterium]|nr:DNA alkylation repair protein [Candidatus Parcubacteria bacterium]
MISKEIIIHLKKHSNLKDREGMARFGINPEYALGVRIPVLRKLAKKIGKDHKLALILWKTEIHEARILATMIDEIRKVTGKQMEQWVRGFNSWDLCDQCCMNLFDKSSIAWEKAIKWTGRDEEFIRRAGFALMASLACHDKEAKDKEFMKFFPAIKKYSTDERNFVRKAVNWALRGIGKRNLNLNKEAIRFAGEIQKIDSKSARWIANDAIKELTNVKIRRRLRK